MGYRSDVCIKVSNNYKLGLAVVLNQKFEATTSLADNVDYYDGNTFYITSVKWYEGYRDIDCVMEFLKTLPDEEYGFIRIGEDIEDIEELGEPWDFDMFVSREIRY
jgi:hypothetical protein